MTEGDQSTLELASSSRSLNDEIETFDASETLLDTKNSKYRFLNALTTYSPIDEAQKY